MEKLFDIFRFCYLCIPTKFVGGGRTLNTAAGSVFTVRIPVSNAKMEWKKRDLPPRCDKRDTTEVFSRRVLASEFMQIKYITLHEVILLPLTFSAAADLI